MGFDTKLPSNQNFNKNMIFGSKLGNSKEVRVERLASKYLFSRKKSEQGQKLVMRRRISPSPINCAKMSFLWNVCLKDLGGGSFGG